MQDRQSQEKARPSRLWKSIGLSASAFAAFTGAWNLLPARAVGSHPFDIPHAAHIYLTERGQRYLEQSFPSLLSARGVDLRSGNLPAFSYTSPQAFRLDRLPTRFQGYSKTIEKLREALSNWLIGFELNDPRFQGEITNSRYSTDEVSVDLRTDLAATQALPAHRPGVVFALDVSLPRIRIEADRVRARDLNNRFLGDFGLNSPWIEAASSDHPLTVTVMVRVNVNSQAQIAFETLGVSTNLATLPIRSGYRSPLVMPRVRVRINGTEMPLDTREIERAFIRKQADLIRMAQHHLKDFIETELPARLDSMVYSKIRQGFVQSQTLSAPGADPYGGSRPIEWALRPSSLSAARNFVKIGLAGFVDDPTVSWDDSAQPLSRKPDPVSVGRADADYDLAFALSTDILNRAMLLGFTRGGLSNVEIGDGVPMSLAAAPYVLTDLGSSNSATLNVTLRRETSGAQQTLALYSPFEIESPLTIRARPRNCGTAFDLVSTGVQIGSARIPNRFHRFETLDSVIRMKFQEILMGVDSRYSATPRVLAEAISVPTELFGVPMRLHRARWDQNGYLILQMRFGQECTP